MIAIRDIFSFLFVNVLGAVLRLKIIYKPQLLIKIKFVLKARKKYLNVLFGNMLMWEIQKFDFLIDYGSVESLNFKAENVVLQKVL